MINVLFLLFAPAALADDSLRRDLVQFDADAQSEDNGCEVYNGMPIACGKKGCSYDEDAGTCSNNYPDCITEFKRPVGRKLGEWFSSNVDDCASGCLANEDCEIWKYDAKKETCQLVNSWPGKPKAHLVKGSKKVQTGTHLCNNMVAKSLE